jgi:hypothetical protein
LNGGVLVFFSKLYVQQHHISEDLQSIIQPLISFIKLDGTTLGFFEMWTWSYQCVSLMVRYSLANWQQEEAGNLALLHEAWAASLPMILSMAFCTCSLTWPPMTCLRGCVWRAEEIWLDKMNLSSHGEKQGAFGTHQLTCRWTCFVWFHASSAIYVYSII